MLKVPTFINNNARNNPSLAVMFWFSCDHRI